MGTKGYAKVFAVLIVMALIAGTIAGCGGKTTTVTQTVTQTAAGAGTTTTVTQVVTKTVTSAPVTTAAPAQEEEVRVAVIFAFSGPFAPWGIAWQRTTEYWANKINAEGGIKTANKTYKVKVLAYDDKFAVPSEVLKMATKATLEDGVKVIFATAGRAAQRAIGPFITENKQLVLHWGGGALSADKRPYQLSGTTGYPMDGAALFKYLREQYPKVQRVALVMPDTAATIEGMAWREIGATVEGYDIVSKEVYPLETVDFVPLATKIVATKPDIICGDTLPSAQWATLIQTVRNLGYKGMFMVEQYDIQLVLDKVPKDYIEGLLSSYAEATPDDTLVPQAIRDFRAYYDKNWPGEWNTYNPMQSMNFMTWVKGVQLAGTVDPTAVRNVLLATNPLDQPLMGTSYWGGKEIWGGNIQLMTPSFVVKVTNGKNLVAQVVNFGDYWPKIKDVALQVLGREKLLSGQE